MLAHSTLRGILGALMGVIGTATVLAQEGRVPDQERVAAAKTLMEVTGVNKQLDLMVDAMAEGFRKGAREAAGSATADAASKEFDRRMAQLMSYRQAMLEDFAALYAEKFAAEELKAVADFYRSPAGAKFIQTMPELIQAGAQIGMKYSQKVMQGEQPKP